MRPLCYFAFTLLCSVSFASEAPSSQCSGTQYTRQKDGASSCCDMCQPGHYFVKHCDGSPSSTQCKPCDRGRYMSSSNTEYACNFCDKCNESNMVYKSRCNVTHNSVCACQPGYECQDQPCKKCVPVPSTTQPTTTSRVTVSMPGTVIAMETAKDTLWLVSLIALVSVATALYLLLKKNLALLWTSKCDYLLTKTHEPVSEDEEVTKPVQEAGSVSGIKIDP